MRKSNESSIKELIDAMLDSYRLKDKFYEYQLVSNWEKCMGLTIAKRTSNIYIKNKVLCVQLDSAVLRQELSLAKQKVIATMNESVGLVVIEDIVLM